MLRGKVLLWMVEACFMSGYWWGCLTARSARKERKREQRERKRKPHREWVCEGSGQEVRGGEVKGQVAEAGKT